MRLVEGVVTVGGEEFPDVEAFVDRLDGAAREADRREASEGASGEAASRAVDHRETAERASGGRPTEGRPPDGRAGGVTIGNDDTRAASSDHRERARPATREAVRSETSTGVKSPTVQAFDARYVVSRRHLERAVELADRARERGEAIARDRGVEIMLYAAGRRQINRAMAMGVGEGRTPAIVLVEGGDESATAGTVADLLEPAETLGAYEAARVRSFFDVGQAELDATDGGLEGLVLERVALLVVER